MPLIDADALKTDVRRYVLEGTDEFGTISVEVAERSFLRLIDRQPTIEVEPKWIPAKERLPDMHTESCTVDGEKYEYQISDPVVCYTDREEVVACRAVYEEGKQYWTNDMSAPFAVTHWLPLPQLPKGE